MKRRLVVRTASTAGDARVLQGQGLSRIATLYLRARRKQARAWRAARSDPSGSGRRRTPAANLSSPAVPAPSSSARAARA
jgi:hypothetical protein